MTMNAYDQACDRMEAARRSCRHAKREAERIIRAADDEWNAADANLARYERAPGLPLDEYNAYRTTQER